MQSYILNTFLVWSCIILNLSHAVKLNMPDKFQRTSMFMHGVFIRVLPHHCFVTEK